MVDLAVTLVPFGCLDYLKDLELVWVDLDSIYPVDVVAFVVAFLIAFAAGPFAALIEYAKQNSKSIEWHISIFIFELIRIKPVVVVAYGMAANAVDLELDDRQSSSNYNTV